MSALSADRPTYWFAFKKGWKVVTGYKQVTPKLYKHKAVAKNAAGKGGHIVSIDPVFHAILYGDEV